MWFDLDDSLNQWKRPIFKFRNLRNSESSVWITNLFPRQAIAKILFLIHSTYTRDTPYHVRFKLDNLLTQSKITTIEIRSSQNSQIFVWKPNFFGNASYTKNSFRFTLWLHWWYSILSLVWFGQLLEPMEKTYF